MQALGADSAVAELIESGDRLRANHGATDAASHPLHIFVFRIGTTRIAIPIPYVLSVSDVVPPSRIPLTPPHVLGLVAQGEHVLPIVDLNIFFGLPQDALPSDSDLRSRFVVVRGGGMEVAIVATRVEGPRDPASTSISPPKSLGNERLSEFTTHEVQLDDGVVYVIDLPAVLEAARAR